MYRRARPSWPPALFRMLAQLTPEHELAVEVGCGSGQATGGLAQCFARVQALDASAEQIAHATAPAHVTFTIAPAEKTCLPNHCADLLLAAQAAHWFRADAFFAEAQRLLKPQGLMALASYDLCVLPESKCNQLVQDFHTGTMGPWWPEQRALVTSKYADFIEQMPFTHQKTTAPDMQAGWTLEQFISYLGTWSATRARIEGGAGNPLPELRKKLAVHWPEQGQKVLQIRWPITLVLGRAD